MIMLGCVVVSGLSKVSRKSGVESGLLLPSHLFLVFPHQDTVLRSCRSNQTSPDCFTSPVVIRPTPVLHSPLHFRHLPLSTTCLHTLAPTRNQCTTASILPLQLDSHLNLVRTDYYLCLDKSLNRILTNRLPPVSEFHVYPDPPSGQHHSPVNKLF